VKRGVVALALAAVLLGLVVHAGAATPEGPRLAISAFTDGPGGEGRRWGVMTIGPLGEDRQRLVGDFQLPIGDALSWSADGSRLALGLSGVKNTTSGPFGTGWQVVGVTAADGGPVHVFPRAFLNAGEPVMSPDGRSVAFQRVKVVKLPPSGEDPFFKTAIWLLNVEDGSVRRLTRWRFENLFEPISYSADRSAVVANLVDSRGHRVIAVDLHSHRTHPLALFDTAATEPTYSPDGSRLAFVRLKYLHNPNMLPRPISELVVANADGSGARRVLRGKGYITSPTWDPSGSRLAFVRNPPDEGVEELESEPGNKVMAINADGTCLTRVFTDPAIAVQGVAWQPGIGREAGPISC
jgi:Tol biopolymer transport system component